MYSTYSMLVHGFTHRLGNAEFNHLCDSVTPRYLYHLTRYVVYVRCAEWHGYLHACLPAITTPSLSPHTWPLHSSIFSFTCGSIRIGLSPSQRAERRCLTMSMMRDRCRLSAQFCGTWLNWNFGLQYRRLGKRGHGRPRQPKMRPLQDTIKVTDRYISLMINVHSRDTTLYGLNTNIAL